MLTEIFIEDFAIIDRLSLRLGPGFTVLTGETGAGKSIIIDALQAALGSRVSADVVRSDARSATVEAIFELEERDRQSLSSLREEYGLIDDDVVILRREISSAGRSTARLNGRAVPASVLSALGAALVDIHGQSDHLSVLRRDRQLELLDRFAGLLGKRADVREAVHEYDSARRELTALVAGQREAAQRLDLLRFQVGEIEAAQLRAGEEEDLVAERNLLANAERLTQLSASAYDALQGGSTSALDAIAGAVSTLRELTTIDPALGSLAERVEASLYDLQDVGAELRRYRDNVDNDPDRLNTLEERLDLFTRLKRKYGATIEDVIAFGEEAREQLTAVESFDERVAELESRVAQAAIRAGVLAGGLSDDRSGAAADLSAAMADALQGLGMKGTGFEVEVARTAAEDGIPLPDGQRLAYSDSGIDSVTFVVSFNPGEPLRPLDRVASGGETSRFLLALKSVLAEADRTPTLVFDEVDVGVGGRRAADVGARMRALARDHQVLSITHMPQVAALGDEHLTVTKAIREGRTTVDVHPVAASERVREIAEMMSGTGTEAARRNAEELLEAAQRTR